MLKNPYYVSVAGTMKFCLYVIQHLGDQWRSYNLFNGIFWKKQFL